METKTFTDKNGLDLVVQSRKNVVIFKGTEDQVGDEPNLRYNFDNSTLTELTNYLEEVANKTWTGLKIKEVDSDKNDYYEYYDKDSGNNGYLNVRENYFRIERPTYLSTKFYQFNKPKMGTFIHKLKQLTKQ